MTDKITAMVLASFAADSLALGAHWIYDTHKIDDQLGRVDTFLKPLKDSYHPNRDRGEFTHYGDQTLVLLTSIHEKMGFDLEHFSRSWRRLFENYDGYMDHATKSTLSNFKKGETAASAGSSSTDLGGASRIAPLAATYAGDLEKLVTASIAQTTMTHREVRVSESAEYFARVAFQVLNGEKPKTALESVVEKHFNDSPLRSWVSQGLERLSDDTRSAIGYFGQSCSVNAAFPAVIHLIGKYENHLEEALVENVMAGGDSAARGMIAGMILGAHTGMNGLPDRWVSALKHRRRIETFLEEVIHKK